MKKLYTTLVALLTLIQLSNAQTFISTGGTPSTTGGPSVSLFYDVTADQAAIFSWHPGVDWKPLGLYARTFSLISYSNRLGLYQDINANVGIGTNTPAYKLDVNGVIYSNSYMSNGQGVYVDGGTGIGINNVSGKLSFRTNNVDSRMIIDALGNVGIGTTNPTTKLAVNGTIRSKEVKVEAGPWPDYVFTSTYVLPTLDQVKSYIDKYQHLPEMPSDKEVVKNGIALGEIVTLQMKKIEELTLYLIEKDKQMKDQQKQLDELKAQMAKLIK